jgi:hypothetical protein
VSHKGKKMWSFPCTYLITLWKPKWEWRYNSIILDIGNKCRRVISFTPSRFTRRGRAPGIHWIGGWVGPRDCLDSVEKRKISCSCCESKPGCPADSLLQCWLSYLNDCIHIRWIAICKNQKFISNKSIKKYSNLALVYFGPLHFFFSVTLTTMTLVLGP